MLYKHLSFHLKETVFLFPEPDVKINPISSPLESKFESVKETLALQTMTTKPETTKEE